MSSFASNRYKPPRRGFPPLSDKFVALVACANCSYPVVLHGELGYRIEQPLCRRCGMRHAALAILTIPQAAEIRNDGKEKPRSRAKRRQTVYEFLQALELPIGVPLPSEEGQDDPKAQPRNSDGLVDQLCEQVRRARSSRITSDKYGLLEVCECGNQRLERGVAGLMEPAMACQCGRSFPGAAVLTPEQAPRLEKYQPDSLMQLRIRKTNAGPSGPPEWWHQLFPDKRS